MTFELLAEDTGGEPGRLDYVSDVEKRENLITSGQTKPQWVLRPRVTVCPLPEILHFGMRS